MVFISQKVDKLALLFYLKNFCHTRKEYITFLMYCEKYILSHDIFDLNSYELTCIDLDESTPRNRDAGSVVSLLQANIHLTQRAFGQFH